MNDFGFRLLCCFDLLERFFYCKCFDFFMVWVKKFLKVSFGFFWYEYYFSYEKILDIFKKL